MSAAQTHSNDTVPAPAPTPALALAQQDDAAFRDILHELAELGIKLLRDLHADNCPAAAKAEPHERVARSVRRAIVLARHIAQHPAELAQSPAQALDQAQAAAKLVARKRIVRQVDDAIERKFGCDEHAESLRDELRERLDDPAIDLAIVHLPLNETIANIRRDLGLDNVPGARPWPRRTPDQVRALEAIATRASSRAPDAAAPSDDEIPNDEIPDDDIPDDDQDDPADIVAALLRRPRVVRDG